MGSIQEGLKARVGSLQERVAVPKADGRGVAAPNVSHELTHGVKSTVAAIPLALEHVPRVVKIEVQVLRNPRILAWAVEIVPQVVTCKHKKIGQKETRRTRRRPSHGPTRRPRKHCQGSEKKKQVARIPDGSNGRERTYE